MTTYRAIFKPNPYDPNNKPDITRRRSKTGLTRGAFGYQGEINKTRKPKKEKEFGVV